MKKNNNKQFFLEAIAFLLSARQRLLKIPTDPKEIHRRADLIRARLAAERRLGRLAEIEKKKIREDLDLIKFDAAVKESNK
mgnify:CR=1 FL=1|jgi:hypothetical protein